MKKLLFIVLFFPIVVSAQNDLRKSLEQVAEYLHNLNEQYEEASKLLSSIEPMCNQSDDYEIQFQYCFVKTALLIEYEEKYEEAMPYIQKGIKIAEEHLGIQSPEYIQLLWAAGDCLEKQGDLDGAINYMHEAYVKGETVFKTNAEILGLVAGSLAYLYEEKGDYAEVEKWYLLAQSIAEMYFPKSDFRYCSKLYFLGDFYSKQGYSDKALEAFQRVVQLTEEGFGKNSLEYTRNVWRLAMEYSMNNDLETAIKLFHEGLDIVEKHFENEYGDLEFFYENLVSDYFRSGKKKEAYPYAVNYKTICKEMYGINSEKYGNICNSLFVILIEMEEFDKAEKELNESAQSLLSIHGENSMWYATFLHNKGSLLMKQEKYEEAKNFLLKAKELQEQIGGKAMPRTIEYLNTVQNKLK